MRRWYLRKIPWSTAVSLLRVLQKPHFLYQKPGQAVYIPAGQPFFSLYTRAASACEFECVNPSKADWELTVEAGRSAIKGILEHLCDERGLEVSLMDIEAQIKLWERTLPGLPAVRRPNLDAVSRPEVREFIKKLKEGRARIQKKYDRVADESGESQEVGVTGSSTVKNSPDQTTHSSHRKRKRPQA